MISQIHVARIEIFPTARIGRTPPHDYFDFEQRHKKPLENGKGGMVHTV